MAPSSPLWSGRLGGVECLCAFSPPLLWRVWSHWWARGRLSCGLDGLIGIRLRPFPPCGAERAPFYKQPSFQSTCEGRPPMTTEPSTPKGGVRTKLHESHPGTGGRSLQNPTRRQKPPDQGAGEGGWRPHERPWRLRGLPSLFVCGCRFDGCSLVLLVVVALPVCIDFPFIF